MIKQLTYACALAVIGSSGSAMAKVNQQTLEDYARHAKFIDMKISTKGSYLAATARADDGSMRLTVLSVKDREIVSIIQGKPGESIFQFDWASDDRIVAATARDYGMYEQPYLTGDIMAVNADGSNKRVIAGPRSGGDNMKIAFIADVLPENDDQIMITSRSPFSNEPYIELERVKISSGRKRSEGKIPLRAYKNVGVGVIVDAKGNPRVALGTDPNGGNQSVIVARENEDAPWQEIMRFDANEGSFTPLTLLDEHTLVGLSDNNTNTQAITTLNLKTNKQEVYAAHPKTDLLPVYSYKNGRPAEVIGAAYEYDEIDVLFFDGIKDKGFASVIHSLRKAFKNQIVTITSSTLDNKLMVVRTASANNPRQFYLFDNERRKLLPLSKAKPWLDVAVIPQTQIIDYQSRDGHTIKALLTLPLGEAKDLPLILLPHGGPHGIRDSITSMDGDAKVLASHGYAVLQPNFRGSGGYGKDFEQLGHRNWGTTMINDMTDGVQHLISSGIADKQRVCVYGASYGGYAAVQSAIREPDLYQCVVGFVGVYDLDMMFNEGDISEAKAGINYLNRVLPATKEERQAQSPVYNVDKLKAPIFIIQGSDDARVPKEHAFALRDALKERNHPFEWMMKDGEGHGFYNPDNNIERWQKMLAFFDKYIGE
ncbi:alpha/beta hydrolase family protein [Pseudoalteromonas sp. T1lg48]|uniref:alpha/beta hydrolase family protein n=1 Tax=Pseudoalteromonas sp. T1lg48 TaxID=2077100 RepID=UPI000CF6BFBD|nr:S9 family peptidase [Pseudoalteromonas sp. T1lg48]